MAGAIEALDFKSELRWALERIVNASMTPQRIAARARIFLLGPDRRSQEATLDEGGVTRPTVLRWERRSGYELAGLD